jgi:S-adenosylmethionine:tRNA ribosyltransferase-isomerase
MELRDYDYELPPDLIAQYPLERRDASRMLIVYRKAGNFVDSEFRELPDVLKTDDIIVLNNTRVFPARLFGTTDTGAKVEVFLVEQRADRVWEALVRPAKRFKPGHRIIFGDSLDGSVVEIETGGKAMIEFRLGGNEFFDLLDKFGRTPLPPYIKRERSSADSDRERYQTVYARSHGAIAAPTAGLHFTQAVLEDIKRRGVDVVEITLHVGYGTFEPVRVENLAEHRVLPEHFEIGTESADALNRAKDDRRRIIAIGTTTTRALEANYYKHQMFAAECGLADLTITPGYEFKAIDGLLTNFHLPKSSLLILVSTFAGRELIMKAYEHAVREKYRFYSYGDCMLVI